MFSATDWIISLLITLFAYGAFPVLFSLLWRKEIEGGRYRMICFIVNFAVAAAFMIWEGATSINGFAYFLWTTAFSSVGKRILNKRGVLFSF